MSGNKVFLASLALMLISRHSPSVRYLEIVLLWYWIPVPHGAAVTGGDRAVADTGAGCGGGAGWAAIMGGQGAGRGGRTHVAAG
ncbi:hypothetical protein GCM10010417_53400 [Streptomyces carpaticus]